MPVIGFLGGASAGPYGRMMAAFRQGLNEIGYVEDRNVAIEYRWAEGQNDRLPALAADLVRRQVTVITTTGTPETLAAKAATTTIPIVFQVGIEPVQVGLVASLSRPGGNLTGVTKLERGGRAEAAGVAARGSTHGYPHGPTPQPDQSEPYRVYHERRAGGGPDPRSAAPCAACEHGSDIDDAFAALVQLRAGALVIGSDVFFNSRREHLAALALRHAVPAIFQFREFAVAGGLMSYGANFTDSYRQVGVYTGRVLKGEKPADLPVHQSTKVELIINLKTAKALGITFPLTVLGRADEVIE